MNENNPQFVFVVDDYDARGIEKKYYKEYSNDRDYKYIGTSDSDFAQKYNIKPRLNDVYYYDNCACRYIILDENIYQNLTFSYLNAFITVLGLMGATKVECQIDELSTKEIDLSNKSGICYKELNANLDLTTELKSELSNKLDIKRNFGVKNIKSVEEVELFLQKRNLNYDINFSNLLDLLEQMKYHEGGQLAGSYDYSVCFTESLTANLEMVARLSITPLFAANNNFQLSIKKTRKISQSIHCEF